MTETPKIVGSGDLKRFERELCDFALKHPAARHGPHFLISALAGTAARVLRGAEMMGGAEMMFEVRGRMNTTIDLALDQMRSQYR